MNHGLPFREMMIHMRNAVRVRASGKIRSRTRYNAAFWYRDVSWSLELYSGGGRQLTSSSTSTVPTEYITMIPRQL